MKTIFYNANVYQGNKEFAQAFVVEDGKIISIGNNETILKNYLEIKQIDLKGKTVLPGFNDAHMHLFSLAKTFGQVSISNAKSINELIEISINFKNNYPRLCEKGIYARGFIEDNYPESRMPNANDLDLISKNIPIVFSRVCGHACVCNHKALEMLDELYGLDSLPINEIDKDEKGNLTGIIYEMTVFKATNLIPELSKKELKELVYKALKYCAEVGLTSIQSNDINDFNNEDYIFEIIDELYDEYPNLIRYTHQCCFKDYDDFKKTLENNQYHLKHNNDKVTLGPLKLYKDGSLGASTALMYDGYVNDPQNHGIEVLTEDEIYEYTKLANKYNLQVITHSIGDRAIDEVSNAYIKANGSKDNPNRHGIVHCQITTKDILKKIGDNHLYIFYQPIFLEYDLHIVYNRVSKQLAETSYAFKSAIELGAEVSFSSDCPIEDCNAFYNLHSAINRRDLNNSDVYLENECLDLYKAIDCFTVGSAKAEFKENELGLLKEGYLADFIVIDENIFIDNLKDIKNIKPVATFVGGELAYIKDNYDLIK